MIILGEKGAWLPTQAMGKGFPFGSDTLVSWLRGVSFEQGKVVDNSCLESTVKIMDELAA
jgi:hypothetical protein